MSKVSAKRRLSLRGLALAGALAAMVLATAAAIPGRVGQAADPEPTVVEYPASNYDPGRGWPEGWTPPAAPDSIPEEVRLDWEDIRSMVKPVPPEKLEFRLYSPPEWTKSYPYEWRYDFVNCGMTTYAYYYPYPDTNLYYSTHNVTITAAKGIEPGCAFAPVRSIKHDHEPTPEEREQFNLAHKLSDDAVRARGGMVSEGGLVGCDLSQDGSVDKIVVCLNNGNASAKFDMPAFLDVSAGRVRVPVRFVSEMMGATVTWDQPTKTVTIDFPEVTRNVVHPVSLSGYQPADWFSPESLSPNRVETYDLEDRPVTQARRVIQLTVDDGTALVDGKTVALDAPPVLLEMEQGGRVMIPVRFVSEQMGAKVYWVGQDPIFKMGDRYVGRYQVHIFTPFHPYYEYPSWPLEHRAQKF